MAEFGMVSWRRQGSGVRDHRWSAPKHGKGFLAIRRRDARRGACSTIRKLRQSTCPPAIDNAAMKRALPARLLASCGAVHAAASAACPTVDAYAGFLALAQRTAGELAPERIAAFQRDFLARFADL
jgi:hypothetical protein